MTAGALILLAALTAGGYLLAAALAATVLGRGHTP